MQPPKAFAGLLIVGLIALVGFAAFSATGLRSAPPLDLPDDVSARIAGSLLAVDLGPELVESTLSPTPAPYQGSTPNNDSSDESGAAPGAGISDQSPSLES